MPPRSYKGKEVSVAHSGSRRRARGPTRSARGTGSGPVGRERRAYQTRGFLPGLCGSMIYRSGAGGMKRFRPRHARMRLTLRYGAILGSVLVLYAFCTSGLLLWPMRSHWITMRFRISRLLKDCWNSAILGHSPFARVTMTVRSHGTFKIGRWRFSRPTGESFIGTRAWYVGTWKERRLPGRAKGTSSEHPDRHHQQRRVDQSRSREAGGTGLGLPVAKWTAEAHSGTISLLHEPGEGCTFRFRFPLAVPETRPVEHYNHSRELFV